MDGLRNPTAELAPGSLTLCRTRSFLRFCYTGLYVPLVNSFSTCQHSQESQVFVASLFLAHFGEPCLQPRGRLSTHLAGSEEAREQLHFNATSRIIPSSSHHPPLAMWIGRCGRFRTQANLRFKYFLRSCPSLNVRP